jgi:hypothetical protein
MLRKRRGSSAAACGLAGHIGLFYQFIHFA